MQRDLVGYGEITPKKLWPQGARVIINFVINYEEGSERSILEGDETSENYLTDLPGVEAFKGRHFSVESLFEYGSRAGVWRLLRLFEQYKFPVTVFSTGMALERNLDLADKLKKSNHEVAGHGYRWINYRTVPKEVEKEHIEKTIATLESLTKKKVTGWYTGRKSDNTRNLIVDAGLRYDSDSYADDLPYWVVVGEQPLLIIPYALDTNDMRYVTSPGFCSGDDFFKYLRSTFDELYLEGDKAPKLMTIGLHPRISGHPGRCHALRRFIEYILEYEQIWVCKRDEIADYWYKQRDKGL